MTLRAESALTLDTARKAADERIGAVRDRIARRPFSGARRASISTKPVRLCDGD